MWVLSLGLGYLDYKSSTTGAVKRPNVFLSSTVDCASCCILRTYLRSADLGFVVVDRKLFSSCLVGNVTPLVRNELKQWIIFLSLMVHFHCCYFDGRRSYSAFVVFGGNFFRVLVVWIAFDFLVLATWPKLKLQNVYLSWWIKVSTVTDCCWCLLHQHQYSRRNSAKFLLLGIHLKFSKISLTL